MVFLETLPDRGQALAPQGQIQAEGKGERRSQGLPGLVVMLVVYLPTGEGLHENKKIINCYKYSEIALLHYRRTGRG
jgi:hypothetical protein